MSLFGNLPRTPRKIRMHVMDAGGGCCLEPGQVDVRYKCDKCGVETGWENAASITEARRGIPCPNCNKEGRDEA